jgi:hypothetical protein
MGRAIIRNAEGRSQMAKAERKTSEEGGIKMLSFPIAPQEW